MKTWWEESPSGYTTLIDIFFFIIYLFITLITHWEDLDTFKMAKIKKIVSTEVVLIISHKSYFNPWYPAEMEQW